ncbi:hypothetical protein PTE30175_01323 [Pandoraea terrae]|uniref:HTH cro/C1-type domain-containing protein n=1 Tax=Pandoraea terrae TaxID=1537710 RepID=A0A5E4TDL5_9BURK|nr:helix-turn-helix transcriptional regulator [Pandoraea terrae]VVD86306.1 hypothetical protein PTE30175_01323 [Pandoraea terrae]
MLTHDELIAKALKRPGVKRELDRLEREEFAVLDVLLRARREAGLSQAEVAARMGTHAPAVTRIERGLASGKHSPSIATIQRYLAACGKRLVIDAAPA